MTTLDIIVAELNRQLDAYRGHGLGYFDNTDLRRALIDGNVDLVALAAVIDNRGDWLPISSAPRDGTPVECLWPSYGQPAGRMHQGLCVFKRDWYSMGKPVELEGWWTGTEFKNPTSKDPTHWRGKAS